MYLDAKMIAAVIIVELAAVVIIKKEVVVVAAVLTVMMAGPFKVIKVVIYMFLIRPSSIQLDHRSVCLIIITLICFFYHFCFYRILMEMYNWVLHHNLSGTIILAVLVLLLHKQIIAFRL